jgi:hypothetical protein
MSKRNPEKPTKKNRELFPKKKKTANWARPVPPNVQAETIRTCPRAEHRICLERQISIRVVFFFENQHKRVNPMLRPLAGPSPARPAWVRCWAGPLTRRELGFFSFLCGFFYGFFRFTVFSFSFLFSFFLNSEHF